MRQASVVSRSHRSRAARAAISTYLALTGSSAMSAGGEEEAMARPATMRGKQPPGLGVSGRSQGGRDKEPPRPGQASANRR